MIKYTDANGRAFEDEAPLTNGLYSLNDCGSESGTWIKLRQAYAEN